MDIDKSAAKRIAKTYVRVLKDTDWLQDKDGFIKTLTAIDGYSQDSAELIWYYIEQELDRSV